MKKVLGMGNALTDILLQVDNGVLEKLNLRKGSMQLINSGKIDELRTLLDFSKAVKATGGSASNTVHGIAKLGGEAGFFGKIGEDDTGDFFLDDTKNNGVIPYLIVDKQQSGSSTVLVSKDGERTMCTFLGAAGELEAADLSFAPFENYDILHIEGFLVQNHALILRAVQMAKAAGMLVSIDLASFNVIEEHFEFLNSLVTKYVDIVFVNEDEARAFTGKKPKDALIALSQQVDIAIVKTGKKGSMIASKGVQYSIKAYKADCIDTTGAGDLYAAGFLYGLARDLPLPVCGQIGSWISSRIVQVMGAKMPDELWEEIHIKVNQIIAAS
ncbi:MAG TPA: adenosine kinase [Paludibacter sp.]|nr:adenosine kinase [Paludibacter sp.]